MAEKAPEIEVIIRKPKRQLFETPLLFVHGTGHAAWCWDEYFLPYFAERGFDCYALSLRGHGRSEGFDKLKWTSIANYVSDVSRVASDLPRTPVVIGHSLGGLVVQKYLEDHEAPAAILITPSPSEGMFWSAFWMPYKHPILMMKIAFHQNYSLMFATPELAKKFLFSKDTDITKIAGYVRKFGKESYWANLESMFNLPKPEKIRTQMLVLGAEEDALVSKRAIEKTARVYNADLRFFPKTGHDLMLEDNWQEAADHMIEWLSEKIR
ncbi:MAG: alpha/beta fold hydrolase [Chloracidobacterium sp.]|nr:alpha/beta fold hydrolase [Chloracidobacterium sp.]